MSNVFKILLIFILITNCTLNKIPKFWSKKEKIEEIKKKAITAATYKESCHRIFLIKMCKKIGKLEGEEIFVKEKEFDMELNPDLKIKLTSKTTNKSFLNNLNNNNGRINYNGALKKISKYKFSKIDNFYQYEPKISFNNNNIIFFDNKGSIFNFDNKTKLIWEKNYYIKKEKKKKPILFFANNGQTLIVVDNIANYYALNIKTGDLLWSKDNTAPFNSQIKIYKDKFFVIDFENTLRAYSIKNGNEIWNIKTQNSLIRSQKKLSIAINDKNIFFNNSLGDISAVNISTGELIWQTPTQSSLVYDEGFFLQNSDIVINQDSLYFSNNKNQFFSIDIKTGILNWKQKVNSHLTPTIVDNYIFTISLEGYLIVIDKNSGDLIRMNDLFQNLDKKYLLQNKMLKHNIIPVGFIVGKNNIYLTTTKGKLHIIDITNGQTVKILKIDNKKVSRPSVLNQDLFIATENSIIKLN